MAGEDSSPIKPSGCARAGERANWKNVPWHPMPSPNISRKRPEIDETPRDNRPKPTEVGFQPIAGRFRPVIARRLRSISERIS